jgi:signal transduction histidine kinase
METTPVPTAHGSERIVVLAVGGLGILTGALYLWAVHVFVASGADAPVPAAGHVVFVAANTAAAGLLWWHRRCPVRVFAAILGVHILSALATGTTGNGGLTLALWFSVFALAAYAPLGRACIAIAIGWVAGTALKVHLALDAGHAMSLPEIGLGFVADVGFFYLACGVLGLGFRFPHQRAREAAAHVRLLEENARAIHAEAVATERNRLARDLHDLAAHELVDVLLSARALQITNDDPTLPEIEQKTARALDNMRAVVRTLREDDDRSGHERLPLADAAEQAIDAFRRERGIDVTPAVRVTAPVDDASVLTVLSVLKETVLNASRHSPGTPVTVALDSDASGVRLMVANSTAPSGAQTREGTGYGLIGAAERARLLGGTFDARRTADGDWIATLRLPPGGAPTETSPMQEAR